MLENYKAQSGTFVPVFTLEIQILESDADRILDAIIAVHPLPYGRYHRNASVSGVGKETTVPQANSTTSTHEGSYETGTAMTYEMVELKISIERDLAVLEKVMDVIHEVHHYEEPVIYLREDWTSRSAYNPNGDNPHRWWNNGQGLPETVNLVETK